MGSACSDPAEVPPRDTSQRALNVAVLATVVACSLCLAALQYREYLSIARYRWDDTCHDRNAHYLLGLDLALDLRQGDVPSLVSHLSGARVWPPLHGMLVATVLLIGGLDYRLAVLPSLASWAGMLVFGFLAARRLAPHGGNLAGVAAVALIAASPAHRAYATDTMLESLGAFLTLVVLYAYVDFKHRPTVWSARRLGAALTAIFLTKYNYWALASAGLVAAELWQHRLILGSTLRHAARRLDGRGTLRNELREPLNYALAISFGLFLPILLRGNVKGNNLLLLVYVCALARAAKWWLQAGSARFREQTPQCRQLVLWHVWPMAIWFLWPKRLGYFLWFLLTPHGRNSDGAVTSALRYYGERAMFDYHASLLSAVVVGALAAVALFSFRRGRSGATAILFLLLIAGALTLEHPNRKSRFLHSWIPVAWVAAGMGLATIAGPVRPGVWGRSRRFAGVAAVAGVVLMNTPQYTTPGRSPARGHAHLAASTRDLTDYYVQQASSSRRVVFFATLPMKHLAHWSLLEAFRDRDRYEVFFKHFGASPERNRERFNDWLARTSADTLVLVDVPAGSYFDFSGAEHYRQFRELVASQEVFRRVHEREFPQYACTVTIWRRDQIARPEGGDTSPRRAAVQGD